MIRDLAAGRADVGFSNLISIAVQMQAGAPIILDTIAGLLPYITGLAARGATIVVASSDFEQLETLCDRVLIFGHGRIAAELRDAAISKSAIADCCFGTETLADEVAKVAYDKNLATVARPNDLLGYVQSQMYDPRY